MQPTDEEMENCIDKAISEAISKNILVDYLAIEDAVMLINEYHEKPEVAAQKMNAPLELVLESLNQKK